MREALEGRPALLVVDDAWTIDHADAFSVTVPPARLLITTRNSEVLVGLGAEERRVDVLSPSDALKMLADWVGEKSPDKLPLEAAEAARECGYLPLALAMIGATVRLNSRSTASLTNLSGFVSDAGWRWKTPHSGNSKTVVPANSAEGSQTLIWAQQAGRRVVRVAQRIHLRLTQEDI